MLEAKMQGSHKLQISINNNSNTSKVFEMKTKHLAFAHRDRRIFLRLRYQNHNTVSLPQETRQSASVMLHYQISISSSLSQYFAGRCCKPPSTNLPMAISLPRAKSKLGYIIRQSDVKIWIRQPHKLARFVRRKMSSLEAHPKGPRSSKGEFNH